MAATIDALYPADICHQAVKVYAKAVGETNPTSFVLLEKAFRENSFKTYIIAKVRELAY